MADEILTQQRLRDELHYDPYTGFFTKNRFAVGSYQYGYLRISIGGQAYSAHRLAWLYCNGEISDGLLVDHINGQRHDNRIANLRLVTHTENMQNVGVKHTPTRLQKMLQERDKVATGVDWHLKRFACLL